MYPIWVFKTWNANHAKSPSSVITIRLPHLKFSLLYRMRQQIGSQVNTYRTTWRDPFDHNEGDVMWRANAINATRVVRMTTKSFRHSWLWAGGYPTEASVQDKICKRAFAKPRGLNAASTAPGANWTRWKWRGPIGWLTRSSKQYKSHRKVMMRKSSRISQEFETSKDPRGTTTENTFRREENARRKEIRVVWLRISFGTIRTCIFRNTFSETMY